MVFGPAYALIEAARLTQAAQQVVDLRLRRLGAPKHDWADWGETQTETSRMVAEKPVAFLRAWTAASRAVLSGGTPDVVLRAWLGPLTQEASANRRRLTGRGPSSSFSVNPGLQREPNQ